MLATAELIAEATLAQRLADALPRYLREVPLYQSRPGIQPGADTAWNLETLRHLPLITKEDIRKDFPLNFLREEAAVDRLLESQEIELEHTSGTSETRTTLLLPAGWWAEQESRALRLNPQMAAVLEAFPAVRRATLSSPVCSSEVCFTGVPSREERTIGSTRFLSLSRYPFLWSESDLARMAEETSEWDPQFLDVDPAYGVAFARYCERCGLRFNGLRFILSSYEFLSVTHRRILERAFGVPVFDLYGSTETGHLLAETEAGNKRASLETAALELLDPGEDGVGELVITTLTNEFMPLVRYRIGDLVERLDLPYGTRYHVHGRVADAFRTAEGRRVTTRQVDQCFVGMPGIAHYQLVQRKSGPWLLRYVADGAGPERHELSELSSRIRDLLCLAGGLEVESAELLMPEPSGKFRLGYALHAQGQ